MRIDLRHDCYKVQAYISFLLRFPGFCQGLIKEELPSCRSKEGRCSRYRECRRRWVVWELQLELRAKVWRSRVIYLISSWGDVWWNGWNQPPRYLRMILLCIREHEGCWLDKSRLEEKCAICSWREFSILHYIHHSTLSAGSSVQPMVVKVGSYSRQRASRKILAEQTTTEESSSNICRRKILE